MSDYYTTLGVDKNANDADIKKAFRNKAAQHHPDKGGDPNTFKEINEAYQTLKDPQKRSEYDNPTHQFHFQSGNSPFSGNFTMDGDFENISDLFSSMFGRPGGMHRARQKGRDVQLQMPLTLEEIASGIKKTINVDSGTGEKQILEVNIPPGMRNGSKVRYKGRGQKGPVENGDLYLVIHQISHPRFERQGNDVYSMQEISMYDAILGCQMQLETVNKKSIKYTVPEGTQSETRLKLAGHGIDGGDHYVILQVKTPERLTEMQKQVILKLKNNKI